MSDRYQREIEEILKQAGEVGNQGQIRRSRPGFWRLIWLNISRSLGGKALSLSPGRVMLIAVSVLLSALVFRALGLGIVGPLAWAGLLLFIVGYAMFFVRPRKAERRWRGQPLDDVGETWWDRFRRKLK